MPSMKPRFFDEGVLAKKIATPEPGDCPYTLLLGAGASVTSGIPSAKAMIREWQETLFCDITGRKPPTDNLEREDYLVAFEHWLSSDTNGYRAWAELEGESDTDYGSLFAYFFQQPKERQMYIEKLVKDRKPSFGYLYLAGLIAAKRFNRILTTNFDDLIADALVRYYDTKPIVSSFDSAVAGIRVAGPRPKIIKLHGDFLYDNIKNVRHELKALDVNMEEKMHEMCKDSGLVVVGYAGGDESVMAPLRAMMRRSEYLNMGVHWCVFRPSDEFPPEIPESVERLIVNHESKVHLYAIRGFDLLMERLFMETGCALPDPLVKPHEYSPSKQFYISVTSGSSTSLSPTMHEHLQLIMERLGEQGDTTENLVIAADLKWQAGAFARKRGDTARARECLSDGLTLIDRVMGEDGTSLSSDLTAQVRASAIKRRIGLLIGLGKLEAAENPKLLEEFLQRALSQVDVGVALVKSNEGRSLPAPLRRTFFYNGCCAFGLLAAASGSLPAESERLLRSYVAGLRAEDSEGEHFRKLLEDGDFASLRDKFESGSFRPGKSVSRQTKPPKG